MKLALNSCQNIKIQALDEVMRLVNDDLQLLSEAHFQRYFQR